MLANAQLWISYQFIKIVFLFVSGYCILPVSSKVTPGAAEEAETAAAAAPEAKELVIEDVEAAVGGDGVDEAATTEVATFVSEPTDQRLVDERDLGNDELIRTEYEVENIQVDE